MAHGVVSCALDLVKHVLDLVIYALDSVIYALDPVNHAFHSCLPSSLLRGARSFPPARTLGRI